MFKLELEKLIIKIYDALRVQFTPKPTPLASDLYLGETQRLYHRDIRESLLVPLAMRDRHSYLVGASGSGKTSHIFNAIKSDIVQNAGFCLIDPHSDLTQNVIKFLASLWNEKDQVGKEEIARRTIIFEPYNPAAIVGINPLEVLDGSLVYPCVLELVEVFKNKWPDMWGPRLAEILRATLVVLAENNLTLLEGPAVLCHTAFRNSLIKNLKNEDIKDFFINRYGRLKEWDKTKYRESTLNKMTEFIVDANVRHTIGQTKSSLDLRRAMDDGKWVIMDLSKGRLKINSALLGGLILAKIQMAALSRTDIPFDQRKLFFVYVDEFQNFISSDEAGDISSTLSESRKYALSLILANQNLSQINSSLLGAILGNVNVIVSFRLSRKDAMVIAPEIDPEDKDSLIGKLVNLKVGEAFVKVKTKPARLVKLPYPEIPQVDEAIVEEFKKHCASFHARSAEEIEKEIQERHQRLGLKQERKQDRKSETAKTAVEEKNEKDGEEEGQNEW